MIFATSLATNGSIVDESRNKLFLLAVERSPLASVKTDFTWGEDGSMVTTAELFLATIAGSLATITSMLVSESFDFKESMFAGLMSKTVKVFGACALARFAAMEQPMFPKPMNPRRAIFSVFCAFWLKM